MRKTIFISLGFLLLISALTALTIWRMPDFSSIGSFQDILPKEFRDTFPGIKQEDDDKLQKFISPDAEFQIEYPANWITVSQKELLQSLSPEDWSEKYNLQALLLVQNIFNGKFAQLIIYKGTFEIPIKEIFRQMEESSEKQGWIVENVKLETAENEGIFEGKYKNPAGTLIRSKEKILISGNERYLVSAFALEKDWQELEQTIDKILKSAIILREK